VPEDVNLQLPAGAVVALVGENGAGKSTLVKLLCRFYEPSEGRVLVDGVDLSRIPAADWRARTGGAFQDFMRFEFRVRRTVGLGDQPREELTPAVTAAVARAGATDMVEGLPQGLQTQLGGAWSEGVEPSFGQWQKLALARGFMREESRCCWSSTSRRRLWMQRPSMPSSSASRRSLAPSPGGAGSVSPWGARVEQPRLAAYCVAELVVKELDHGLTVERLPASPP
jgi:ABC-type hemin transport system ATPase subunit